MAQGIEGDAFQRLALLTGKKHAEILEVWSERAAIREYLGEESRVKAELLAFRDTESMLGIHDQYRRADPAPSKR